MRFTCSKAALAEAVAAVAKVVPKSSHDAHLVCILLSATDDGRLVLSGTDGLVFIKLATQVTVSRAGAVAISGAVLEEIVNSLQSSRSNDVTASVESDLRLFLESADARYNLHTVSPESFPMLPEADVQHALTMSGELLRDVVRKTAIVADSGKEMGAYNEVFGECTGSEVVFVATDSVRLAIQTLPRETRGLEHAARFRGLFPARGLGLVAKIARPSDTVRVFVDEGASTAVFSFADVEIRVRLADKTFPNFRSILPKAQSRIAVLKRDELAGGLRGVLPLSKDKKHRVDVSFESDRLVLKSSSPEHGDASREVATAVPIQGDPGQMAFNGKFISDFLSVIDTDEVAWSTSKSSWPAELIPSRSDGVLDDDYRYVVMPITTY